MITTVEGNLIEAAPSGFTVHGCNAQGVMGAGFAAQIKDKYPDSAKYYFDICRQADSAESILGQALMDPIRFKDMYHFGPDGMILVHGITQNMYGRNGTRYVDYNAVRSVFETVAEFNEKIHAWDGIYLPVRFPLIGCGLGGGNWSVVSAIIEETVPDYMTKELWLYKG